MGHGCPHLPHRWCGCPSRLCWRSCPCRSWTCWSCPCWSWLCWSWPWWSCLCWCLSSWNPSGLCSRCCWTSGCQTGVQSVVGGHAYSVGGVEHIARPAVSYAAGVPQNLVNTIALPAPVIPAPPAPYAAIPPAPVPAGYAPADTVTQQRVLAPVRTHTRIPPQATNIIPQVNVQKYNVDFPVHIPTPVERIITVNKHVAAPYDVAIPRAVPVAAPYKVHPVQEIVETPHVHHATIETHSAQQVITPVHTPVHAVSHQAVGVAQSVQHVGYAAHAVAPAVAHVGYAAGVAHAGLGLAGVGHAGFAHAGLGYAGLAAAAPIAALAHQY